MAILGIHQISDFKSVNIMLRQDTAGEQVIKRNRFLHASQTD